MKLIKMRNLMLMLLAIPVMLFYISCKDEDVVKTADLTALNSKINQANEIYKISKEGRTVDTYPANSKLEFQKIIDLATALVNSKPNDEKQSQVAAALANLQKAIQAFLSKKIVKVPTEGLVAYWLFSGDAKDSSGNANDGVLKSGIVAFGSGAVPSLTSDRFGIDNKAYYFNKGANIEVPYSLSLNPKQITISAWIYVEESREHNRFICLQSWIGYKLQLQSGNKLFFTVGTEEGPYNEDSEPSLKLKKWYHVAVTYGSHIMTFYIDGVKTKVKPDSKFGDLSKVSGHNFTIGVGSSRYARTTKNFTKDKIIPIVWGGYFNGKIDDIRIYNRAISPAELLAIYYLEKT